MSKWTVSSGLEPSDKLHSGVQEIFKSRSRAELGHPGCDVFGKSAQA